MCAVVDHQVAEFNTTISCPVNNLRCNRWVQHMITRISRHSTQGKVESKDLARSFCWCASELACLVKKNSSSVCTAQLSSANNVVRFAWFYKFSDPPSKASTWAHSWCRSTAWSLGTVRRKFSDFELIPLNICPRSAVFIANAAMLNDVGSVSHVNLLMNAASHWYWVFKNHNGRSRTALCMPRNKVDSEASGFTKTTSTSRPIDLSQNES